LIFLAANMGLIDTPLRPAMKKMLSVSRDASPGSKVALGWHIDNGWLVNHNGTTYGYNAFLGFDPSRKVGVVVLSNSSNSVDDLARRILNFPVAGPDELHVGPDYTH
jgi:D-alanyl-D-alanine-carboxypeptidase/D-alanyl-D-alanine-endopeptidase